MISKPGGRKALPRWSGSTRIFQAGPTRSAGEAGPTSSKISRARSSRMPLVQLDLAGSTRAAPRLAGAHAEVVADAPRKYRRCVSDYRRLVARSGRSSFAAQTRVSVAAGRRLSEATTMTGHERAGSEVGRDPVSQTPPGVASRRPMRRRDAVAAPSRKSDSLLPPSPGAGGPHILAAFRSPLLVGTRAAGRAGPRRRRAGRDGRLPLIWSVRSCTPPRSSRALPSRRHSRFVINLSGISVGRSSSALLLVPFVL